MQLEGPACIEAERQAEAGQSADGFIWHPLATELKLQTKICLKENLLKML